MYDFFEKLEVVKMEIYLEIEILIKWIFNSFCYEVEVVFDKRLSGSEYWVLSLILSGFMKILELVKMFDVLVSYIIVIMDILVEEKFIIWYCLEVDCWIIELKLILNVEEFVKEIDKKKKEMIVKCFVVFFEYE